MNAVELVLAYIAVDTAEDMAQSNRAYVETTFSGGNMASELKREKRGELEAIRGLAACSVVAGHFFGCFAQPGNLTGVSRNLYSALTNGSAAVVVFFVLSGVVLPLSFFRSGGNTSTIAVAALNRFPRLMLLVFLTVMGSYLITVLGWNYSKTASEISGSTWFASYGFPNATEHFVPDFATALWQGLFGTLFENRSEFNVSLWTMHHELYGSFITFGLAMVFFKAPMRVVYVLTGLAFIALQFTAWRLTPFVVGTALSAFLYQRPQFSLKLPVSLGLIVIGFLFYRFSPANAAYWPTAFIPWGSDDQKGWLIYTLAGVSFILGVVGNELVRNVMNAKWLVALGRYSFAMYAVHMLIMSSLVSLVLIYVAPLGKVPALTIVTIVFVASLAAASYVLTKIDEWWTKRTQSAIKALIATQATAPAQCSSVPSFKGA